MDANRAEVGVEVGLQERPVARRNGGASCGRPIHNLAGAKPDFLLVFLWNRLILLPLNKWRSRRLSQERALRLLAIVGCLFLTL